MVSWIKGRPPLDIQKDDLKARLRDARTRLDDIMATKKRCALDAAMGDITAKRIVMQLETQAATLREEIEIVALAIEAVDQQQAEQQREAQHQIDAKVAEQRTRFLDAQEVERREHIQAAIRRFEGIGNHAQADIWRVELAKVRQRLEAEYS